MEPPPNLQIVGPHRGSRRFDRLATIYVGLPMQKALGNGRKYHIPILMYHGVREGSGNCHPYFETNTSPEMFTRQMRWLRGQGYTTLDLDAAMKALAEGGPKARTVVITFDDGYRDFYTQAFPVLAENGFTATLFLATGRIGDQPARLGGIEYLSWGEVRELHASGVRIGSHTVTHPELATLSAVEVERELRDSKLAIEERVGAAVESFAYPYAFPSGVAFRHRVASILGGQGYRCAVTTVIGRAGPNSEPFFLPRLPVNTWDDHRFFHAKLDGAYDWLRAFQAVSKTAGHSRRIWSSGNGGRHHQVAHAVTPAQGSAKYEVRTSRDLSDPEWDEFVASVPRASYSQSSLWASAKSLLGFRAVRVAVWKDGHICAGAQALIRPLPLAGAFGYVPLGPLVPSGDLHLASMVYEELRRVASMERIRYLTVQPPPGGELVAEYLRGHGMRKGLLELAPTATVLIDLRGSSEAILAKMRKTTRYDVRAAQRKGVCVREGTEDDLAAFHQLLVTTGKRQKFTAYRYDYLAGVWRCLAPRGQVKLFLAELESEPVSGLMAVAVGDTVTYWKAAWSGKHGERFPNELNLWTAITWAKASGYRYFDLGGINRRVANAVLSGGPLRGSDTHSVYSFKLGFSKSIVLSPEPLAYVPNRLFRSIHNSITPQLHEARALKAVLNLLR